MGEATSEIRADIERTRDEMGDTVQALGYKTDVKSRARDKVTGVKDRVVGATPDGDQARDGAKKAVSVAQENPLGLALGAVGVGFIAGLSSPPPRSRTRRSDRSRTRSRTRPARRAKRPSSAASTWLRRPPARRRRPCRTRASNRRRKLRDSATARADEARESSRG